MTGERTIKQKVTVAPYIDMYEHEEELVLVADLPGVDDKSAHITVENGLLTIEGDISRNVDKEFSAIRRERRADAFRRTFRISEAIDVENIKAKMKHGVLTLRLPRREELKARKIEISAA